MLAVEGPAKEFTNVPADNWCNYPKGVMWAYTQKGYTIDSGLDILYYGNIPNGSGLSSSASIEVAACNYNLCTCKLKRCICVGKICCVKEDCMTCFSKYNERRSQCETALAQLQAVKPINSLGELTEEEFDAIADTITDPVNRKRAKHAVYENQRTIRAVEALRITISHCLESS